MTFQNKQEKRKNIKLKMKRKHIETTQVTDRQTDK